MKIVFICKERRIRTTHEFFQIDNNIIFFHPKEWFECIIKIIKNRNKDVKVILNSDREYGLNQLILLVSKIFKVKVGVLITDMPSNYQSAFGLRKKASWLTKKICFIIYPHNIYKDYPFYNNYIWLLFISFTKKSCDPWVEGKNGGEFILHRFKLGLEYNNMNTIKIQDRTLTYLKMNKVKVKKGTLLALPQFYEQGVLSYSDEKLFFNNVLIPDLLNSFGDLVVSLHPRMNPKDYEYLSYIKDVSITKVELYKIVNRYKNFISVNSTTLFYADKCNLNLFVIKVKPLDYSIIKELSNEVTYLEYSLSGNLLLT